MAANKTKAPPAIVTVKVDGLEISVPKMTPDWRGKPAPTTVLQACQHAGIELPHYCYHPRLSVAGNCRMCLVHVGMPGRPGPDGKPPMNDDGTLKISPKQLGYERETAQGVIGCATDLIPGMEIYASSAETKEMREAVLESLLINHPLDCPICDQAGECKLQEYSVEHGQAESEFAETKVHKPKAIDLGPRITLDAERCILCTRCIRVCDEIAKQPQLAILNRGDHSEIGTFPGHDLDHPYSLCTADVCPVGALTSRDFRFRARVWYLRSVDSVCPGCATGCNVHVDHTDGTVRRLRPRLNPAVNDHWMCDEGRKSFLRVQEDRVLQPEVLSDGAVAQATWSEALSKAADRINMAREANGDASVGIVISPWCTNEDLYVIAKLAAEAIGTSSVYVGGLARGESDDILRHADKNPNNAGLKLILGAFGIRAMGLNTFIADLEAASVHAVYLVGDELPSGTDLADEALAAAATSGGVVVQASNRGAATEAGRVVLPAAGWAEVDGTFTNRSHRVQRIRAAVPVKGEAKPHWQATALLAQRMGFEGFEWDSPRAVLRELCERVAAFAGLDLAEIGSQGSEIEGPAHIPSPPPFRGAP